MEDATKALAAFLSALATTIHKTERAYYFLNQLEKNLNLLLENAPLLGSTDQEGARSMLANLRRSVKYYQEPTS